MTFGPVLGALGKMLIMVDDAEAIARISPRWRELPKNPAPDAEKSHTEKPTKAKKRAA